MTQPTLSKHINALERELRVPLFSREGTTLSLTKAGKLVLPYAFTIVESRNQMGVAAKNGASTLAPHLTIGGNVGLRTVVERITLITDYFDEKYSNDAIEISDIEIDQRASIEMTSESAPDLIFCYADEDSDYGTSTEIRLVSRAPLSIVVNKYHKLAARESVTLDDLRNEIFIRLEGNFVSNAWRFVKNACSRAGYAPNCKHVYFPRITDFFKITTQLKQEVLVLTNDYIRQYNAFISENCVVVPIEDDRAYLPLSVLYSMTNENPLIDEAIDIILSKATPSN